MELSPSRLEVSAIAPTHKRRLMLHDPQNLDNIERFGIVRRPDLTSFTNRQLAPVIQTFVRLEPLGEFAQEYYRSINRQDNGKIVSIEHDGDIVGLDGTFDTSPSTNKRLRYKRVWADKASTNFMFFILDDGLNFQFVNGATANTEADFKFGTKNTLKINTKIIKLTATSTGALTFNTGLTITSNKVEVKSPNVTFGNTGTQQALLGTQFINGVMTPFMTTLAGAMQVLAAEAVLIGSPSQTVLTTLATTISSLVGSLPSTLSTQVKLSG